MAQLELSSRTSSRHTMLELLSSPYCARYQPSSLVYMLTMRQVLYNIHRLVRCRTHQLPPPQIPRNRCAVNPWRNTPDNTSHPTRMASSIPFVRHQFLPLWPGTSIPGLACQYFRLDCQRRTSLAGLHSRNVRTWASSFAIRSNCCCDSESSKQVDTVLPLPVGIEYHELGSCASGIQGFYQDNPEICFGR